MKFEEDRQIGMVALGNNQYRIESVLLDDIIASINLKERTIILFDKILKEYDVKVIIENV